MTVQWYPGHMAKTRRKIRERLRDVDAVCEILDARIPASSRDPEIGELTAGKPRIIVLGREDQADPAATARWIRALRGDGRAVLSCDAKRGRGTAAFVPAVRDLLSDRIRAWTEKGQPGRTLRVMVLGIPNVGKSTFIDRIAGRRAARAEDRPGVTRTEQWVPVAKGLDLLDTPGVLWPKFEDPETGRRLAATGAVKDEVVDTEALACWLMDLLSVRYPDAVRARYRIPDLPERAGDEDAMAYGYRLLEAAGRERGLLIRGGEVDTGRMAGALLDDLRSGKLGRMTLEEPD